MVSVNQQVIGQISAGVVLFVGIAPSDGDEQILWMADKIAHLRIFEDDQQAAATGLQRNLVQIDGSALVISQFTLYGDTSRGRRPSFSHAAAPAIAEPVYDKFITALGGYLPVTSGKFGADMQVELVNQGPLTLVLER